MKRLERLNRISKTTEHRKRNRQKTEKQKIWQLQETLPPYSIVSKSYVLSRWNFESQQLGKQ